MNETQQDQYLQAQKLIAEEKWQEASDILEDLISDVDDSEIGRLTIIALYHSQQYIRACTYLFEYLEVMFDSFSDAQIAITILCQNELFVLAREVISSLSQWQEDLLPIVVRGEEKSRLDYQETLQTRLRDFYHLGDYSLQEQQSRLQAAFKLPLNEFVTGAKFLLRDPYTHPLVKSSLVELLSKLQVTDPVTIYWLDKNEYTIVPADIEPLNLLPIVSEGKKLIAEKCGNQNPQTEKMAIQEFQLQAMFLYPRVNQIIKDIDEWTDVLIARIEGKKVVTDTFSSTWQERLSKEIDELIEKH
ncbi:hypothetical protein LTY36_00555 [Limosilactobacillus agrestis]|uniref:TPR repeat-containing protein n=1 Tax=Limosilactobacillus agrestis TaxID=2759748 RepID=A0A7W3UHY0_9LACO|nr:hypothetical protein [Limosilactobacillus agrestis]MBB1095305.1 hypothetical protein [Limosilactobacillus agrestis]MBB1099433.1 hypothetical protein [Limosilactobacillus agrestis]MCD7112902.1 hypothetical protein [Limosilactobacillus agrestis]MCD7120424.1 hypothetical protein [Limosilactobacillus agrestis]MCD7126725.1 hypothetical protein [Limosilactobacillus agrestis]